MGCQIDPVVALACFSAILLIVTGVLLRLETQETWQQQLLQLLLFPCVFSIYFLPQV